MALVPGRWGVKLPSSVGTGESASRLTPVIAAGVRFLLAVFGDFSSPHRLSECPHDVTAACPRVSNERARDGSHSLLQPHLGSGYNTARAGHSPTSVTQSNSGMWEGLPKVEPQESRRSEAIWEMEHGDPPLLSIPNPAATNLLACFPLHACGREAFHRERSAGQVTRINSPSSPHTAVRHRHCAHFTDEGFDVHRGPSARSHEDSQHPREQKSLGMRFLDGLF